MQHIHYKDQKKIKQDVFYHKQTYWQLGLIIRTDEVYRRRKSFLAWRNWQVCWFPVIPACINTPINLKKINIAVGNHWFNHHLWHNLKIFDKKLLFLTDNDHSTKKTQCSMCQKCKWQTINQSKSRKHAMLDRVILTNITKT